MNWQPALATSAFRGLHDELIAYVTLFCDARELLQLAQTNSVFYVFCREEPLWMMLCLHRHGGDFFYKDNWRLTTFFPRDRPAEMPIYPPLTIRGFASDFLYRRWCRCHMDLKNFVPPDAALDPAAKRVKKFETKDLTYQQYFEEYSRVPFILKNAIGNWKASTEWTVEKFIERYPHNAKHRLTHNLDFFGSGKSLQLTFADYFQYISQQNDETPLYIFDPDFGEKLPELLDDYKIDDLKFFKEDLLKDAASANDEKKKKKKEKEQGGASSTQNGRGGSKKNGSANQAASSGDNDNQKKEAENGKRSKSESLRPDFRWVVIGPQRTGAPWHTDPARTSAWNALVKGRKRWAIYPPDSPPPGVSMGKNKNGREHALNMTSLSWYLHVYPTLEPHQKPIEVIQEEGEVIYVPNGWWHLILNLETTIAVTQNFVDSHNLMGFMKDLLDDQQDEPLSQFQHSIKTSRLETFDLFRLMQIPRVHGYLNQDMYVSTFSILEPWKTPIMKILKRHHRALSKFDVLKIDEETKKTQVARLKSLTSRVNPAFGVGKSVLIKFFSHFNQRWGEFDFSSYLAPNFKTFDEAERNGAESPLKRRKQTILQPHELKNAMNLRRAMEESFRIEKETYDMIANASSSPKASQFVKSLQSMVPRLFQSGHMLHVEEVDDEDGEGSFWRWPYVVIEYRGDLDGLDKLVKKGGITKECWLSTAKWISAEFVARLHAVPIGANLHGLYGHSKANWDWYVHYLTCQRKRVMAFHYKEDAIPPQLMNQLEKFLPSSNADSIVKELLPASMGTTSAVLLHGDITQENILGSSSTAAAKSSSVIRKTANSNGAQATSMDLTAYLNSIGCGKYVPLLVEKEELTMASLAFVDEAHLKELGIPLGPRLSILKNAGRGIVNGAAHAKISNGHSDVNASPDVEEEDWETCSSSSSSSDEDDESGPDLQAKRLAKFIGPHEWQPSFVIDFADAKTGDPLYDLVAIFFAALSSDRELWKVTLGTEYWRSYIQREQQSAGNATKLRERFLKLVLLHPSRSVKSLFYYFPDAVNLLTWEDVARFVFEDIFKA